MATIAEAAAHIDLSDRRLKDLIASGIITKVASGAYDFDAVRIEYIRHLRKSAAGHTILTDGDLDPLQERARKDKELADRTALQNAVSRKELLPAHEVSAAVVAVFARVRSRLLSIPVKTAPRVLRLSTISEIRAVIEEETHEALEELSAIEIAGEQDSSG